MRLLLQQFIICILIVNTTNSQDILVKKIWDSAPHNAFTDIIRFKSHFYCAFREGQNHVPRKMDEMGKVRILRSKDGKKWESVVLFELDKYDLRDPKLSITPDKKLMVLMGGSLYHKDIRVGALTHVSFSDNGKDFKQLLPVSIPEDIKSKYDWIWRVTWHGKTGYAVVYQDPHLFRQYITKLLKTTDGVNYQYVCDLFQENYSNEATIRFAPNDEMFILVRRENMLNGLLGQSKPPYTDWQWKELAYRLGGPNFQFLSKDKLYVGTRIFDPNNDLSKQRTKLLLSDINGEVFKSFEFPSGGDTGYTGLLKYKNSLWISYYSSQEGKASVYLSKVNYRKLKSKAKRA